MGGSSGGGDAPDVTGAARAEGQASKEITEQQTWANRPNQVNPWGTVTWDKGREWDATTKQWINTWQQNEKLNPQMQAALDAQMGMQTGRSELGNQMLDRVGNEIGTGMDWDQFGDVQGLEYNPDELRYQAENSAYNKAANRINPDYDGQKEQMEIKLRNQGLRAGDQAWDAEMSGLNEGRNDALEQARLGATAEGRQESGQMYGQQMGSSEYSNQLRQQQIKEEMTKRGFSLNEMNALLSGQQVNNPDFEGFNSANAATSPDLTGAAIAEGNYANGQNASMMAGIGGLAQAGATAYAGR